MAATTPQIDYSIDWKYWDNTEQVTVLVNKPGGSTESITVSDAFRGDIERKAQRILTVQVVEDGQIWSVPSSLLGANVLRQSDTITDGAGEVWKVLESVLMTVGSSPLYWLATTQKQS